MFYISHNMTWKIPLIQLRMVKLDSNIYKYIQILQAPVSFPLI